MLRSTIATFSSANPLVIPLLDAEESWKQTTSMRPSRALFRPELTDVLTEIEQDQGVVICLAAQLKLSAFEPNRRPDIGFIYVQHPEWYLSLDVDRCNGVMEVELDDSRKLIGWDLRRVLQLFQASDPWVFDFLQSQQVYDEKLSLAPRLRCLLSQFYNPGVFFEHYFQMAARGYASFGEHASADGSRLMDMLQAVLPLLWIEKDLGPVPLDMGIVAAEVLEPGEVSEQVIALLKSPKTLEGELTEAIDTELVGGFIRREFRRMEFVACERRRFGATMAPGRRFGSLLDQILRETVAEAVAYTGGASVKWTRYHGSEDLGSVQRSVLDLIQEYAVLSESKVERGGTLPPIAEARWLRTRSFYELLMAQEGETEYPADVFTRHDIRRTVWARRRLRVRQCERTVAFGDTGEHKGRISNLSRGGVLLHSGTALAPGSKIELNLPCLGPEDNKRAVDGEIAWVAGHPAVGRDGYRMGVSFRDLKESEEAQLDAVVVESLETHLAGLSAAAIDPQFAREEQLYVRCR